VRARAWKIERYSVGVAYIGISVFFFFGDDEVNWRGAKMPSFTIVAEFSRKKLLLYKFVYICIYMYMYIYICIYVYIYMCIYIYVHVYISVDICMYMSIIYTFMYTYLFRLHILPRSKNVCIYTYLFMMYIYIYICRYTDWYFIYRDWHFIYTDWYMINVIYTYKICNIYVSVYVIYNKYDNIYSEQPTAPHSHIHISM